MQESPSNLVSAMSGGSNIEAVVASDVLEQAENGSRPEYNETYGGWGNDTSGTRR